jgi:hypothetical protein
VSESLWRPFRPECRFGGANSLREHRQMSFVVGFFLAAGALVEKDYDIQVGLDSLFLFLSSFSVIAAWSSSR